MPSLRCVPISEKKYPKLLTATWIAPNATVIGHVHVGEGSSLWHGVTIRGDQSFVQIGKNSIIQDRVHIMNSSNSGKVEIGNEAFVGPNAQLDGCTIKDYAFIGMGATVHPGAVIESYAMVAAGAVVPAGTVVPSGQVFAGNPASYLRDLTTTEKHQIYEYT